jgi:hypothetical protein
MCRSLIAHLAKQEKEGTIVIPDALLFFNFGSKIEKTILVTQRVKIST